MRIGARIIAAGIPNKYRFFVSKKRLTSASVAVFVPSVRLF
jgi:hypothetical protein